MMKFLTRIFSPACLIFSLLVLFYIFYKSEIILKGIKFDYYLPYYIFSFGLIIFSFVSFFLKKKLKEYLVIIVLSLFSGAYIFEGYLTFVAQENKKKDLFFQQTKKKYDTRTKLEIFKDLSKNEKNIKIAVGPNTYLDTDNKLLPLSGVSNSKTIYCNENGYYAIYLSDRYGFNNPDEEWDKKEIEYLLVGDSFTHGACVNRPNDIASILRNLSKKSVLNLGYAGNGPLIEYAILREYLKGNVKKVIWLYFEENDLNEFKQEINNKILRKYLNNKNFSQNLTKNQKIIDNIANRMINSDLVKREKESSLKHKFIKFIKLYNLRFSLTPFPRPKPQPEFKMLLREAKKIIEQNNSKMYFVYLPEYGRYKNNLKNNNYFLIKKIVKEIGIPFIDINNEIFKKETNPLNLFPFQQRGHYNAKGYRKIAEILYKYTNK